jgi:hypothetical protein
MKVIQPEQSEINKARDLVKPAIEKWVELAGPYGKEVMAIAAKYGSGAKILLKK